MIVSDLFSFASDTSAAFTIYQPVVSVLPGWNLVSVPGVPTDYRSEAVFPGSTSRAYTFRPTGYEVRDTLSNGEGYWLRFDSSGVVPFEGGYIQGDTVMVPAGWSLLGSISYPVPMDSIEQNPPGIITASFGYVPGSGYQSNPLQIQPGQAIWIRTSGAGQVILRRPLVPPLPARVKQTRVSMKNTD
jgi:hypothetical protein